MGKQVLSKEDIFIKAGKKHIFNYIKVLNSPRCKIKNKSKKIKKLFDLKIHKILSSK
jgi:hypothetical protein